MFIGETMNINDFDVSVIYTRDDGSFVINQGLYHVPNEGEWIDLYNEVKEYADLHPENVYPEPTKEVSVEELEQLSRSYRDYMISQTDYLLMPDYITKLDEETLNSILEYRQALRDVPQQENFPKDIVWPEIPSMLVNKK